MNEARRYDRPMRPTSTATRRALLTIATAMVLAAPACGGDDVFPRDDFVRQVTANGVTREVAECTYDGIVDDRRIMDELNRTGGPNSEISAAVDERMSKVIARCFLEAEPDESPRRSTTTTR